MASKNISIREDLYRRLTALKGENQSYSDVIEGLLNDGLKGSYSRLMKHFGAWRDLPEEIDEIILSVRDEMNRDFDKRVKDVGEDVEK